LFACFVAVVTALPFEVRIAQSGAFGVEFSLTNINQKPLTVCVWGTPLDKSTDVFRADMFEITHESGEPVVYTGIVMKRRQTISDFVTLQPGQKIETTVDLLKGYWFPQKGTYQVSLNSYIYIFNEELDLEQVMKNGLADFETSNLISTEVITVDIVDIVSPPTWNEYNDTKLGAVTPNANCDSNRQTQIRTSDTNAGTLISRVRTYLARTCNGGAYVTWMGACDSSRYNTVTTNFNAINNRQSSGYRVDCAGSSCSNNVYAYVFPGDSTFTVYVCGAFWNANINTCAYDSKPGTIIHEISHFNAVAGTQDITYGTTNCQNLAKSNPANAIRNADSHEYLAESCP